MRLPLARQWDHGVGDKKKNAHSGGSRVGVCHAQEDAGDY